MSVKRIKFQRFLNLRNISRVLKYDRSSYKRVFRLICTRLKTGIKILNHKSFGIVIRYIETIILLFKFENEFRPIDIHYSNHSAATRVRGNGLYLC